LPAAEATNKGAGKVWLPAPGIRRGVSWHCQKPQRKDSEIGNHLWDDSKDTLILS